MAKTGVVLAIAEAPECDSVTDFTQSCIKHGLKIAVDMDHTTVQEYSISSLLSFFVLTTS